VVPITNLKKLFPEPFRTRHRSSWASLSLPVRTTLGKLRRWIFPIPHPRLADGKVYLHLGSGGIDHPSFINVDALPAPHIHYVRPIDDLSFLANSSVDLIYACHCLEHFSHLQIEQVLAEWRRVLKSGGVLRLSVPDFDLLLNIYKESGNDLNSIVEVLMGKQDYKYNFHLTAFTKQSLSDLLFKVGFDQTLEWRPGSSELTSLPDFSNYKLQVSGRAFPIRLNLEAIK
jgi:predicted SAM-dependent methyltransferase